jgi:hypothetical protein
LAEFVDLLITGNLTNNLLFKSSDSRLEMAIMKYIQKISNGMHADSILNNVNFETSIPPQTWEQVKGELKHIGVSSTDLLERWNVIATI